MILWIMLTILVLLVVLGVVAIVVASKGKKRKTDYYNYFIIGITWLPLGIVLMAVDGGSIGNIFFILGLVYLAIGLSHKSEWKKNHKTWEQLGDKEKRWKMIAIGLLVVLFLIGVLAFFLVRRGIV